MLIRIVASVVSAALAGVLVWAVVAGRGEDGESVAGLIVRLRDGQGAGRREAASTLGQIVGPGSVAAARALVATLGDPDPELRAQSARSLGTLLRLNPQVTAPVSDLAASALRTTLRDRESRVRAAAASGLESLGLDPRRKPEATTDAIRGEESSRLLARLDGPDLRLREMALSELARSGPDLPTEAVLPPLAAILRTGSPAARADAATILGRLAGKSSAARDLIRAAASSLGVPPGRAEALVELKAALDAEVSPRPSPAVLAFGPRTTRAEAIAALRARAFSSSGPRPSGLLADLESDPARAVPSLIAALRDPRPRVRAAAARALGEFAPPSDARPSVDALSLALSDPEPSVRRASASALAALRGPDRPMQRR
jgi:HEAT repeat protein